MLSSSTGPQFEFLTGYRDTGVCLALLLHCALPFWGQFRLWLCRRSYQGNSPWGWNHRVQCGKAIEVNTVLLFLSSESNATRTYANSVHVAVWLVHGVGNTKGSWKFDQRKVSRIFFYFSFIFFTRSETSLVWRICLNLFITIKGKWPNRGEIKDKPLL